MTELLTYIFSSFRSFMGTVLLISWIGFVVTVIIRAWGEARKHMWQNEHFYELLETLSKKSKKEE